MTYQINNSAGDVVATIEDGVADSTSTSLTLVGRKYAGYGEILQENIVHIMENFAFSVAPAHPMKGQMWYDTTANSIKYYDSSAWHTLANVDQLTANINTVTTNFNSNLNSAVSTINGLIGLINANVTSANSHISSLETLKAPIANPAFTGNPTAPTASHGDNDTTIATTAFVQTELGYYATSDSLVANITAVVDRFNTNIASNVNTLTNNINLLNANLTASNTRITSLETLKSPIASPTFTGTPAAPTGGHLLATTQIATTAFVRNELGYYSDSDQLAANVTALITRFNTNIASNVDTINSKIASTNANVAAANTAIASLNTLKAPLANPTFTGTPAAPTANVYADSTQVATTAFVHNIIPAGIIVQWYGATNNVPYGWALCNGQTVNGYTTPNLYDKFVIAAGNTYSAGSSGGATAHVHTTNTGGGHSHGGAAGQTVLGTDHIPSHNHSITVTASMGNHTHNFTDVYAIVGDYQLGGSTASTSDRNGNYIYPSFYAGNASDGDYDNGAYGFPSKTESAGGPVSITAIETTVGGGHGHTHSITADAGHTHTVNSTSNIPPYVALCYIMKVV